MRAAACALRHVRLAPVRRTAAAADMATSTHAFGPKIAIEKRHAFAETRLSYAFVNLKPVVPGHVLVAPKRLVPRVSDLDADEVTDLFALARDVGNVVQSEFQGTSLTFTVQDGPEAGQTVPHVHVHVLPRRAGDFEPNDVVYDKVDEAERAMDGGRSLDDDRKPRTDDEMAQEASALRAAMEAS